jgi:hypothetical protein
MIAIAVGPGIGETAVKVERSKDLSGRQVILKKTKRASFAPKVDET